MKTEFSRLFLPALVFVFAVAAAFTTNSVNAQKKAKLSLTGWTHPTGQPCQVSIDCNDFGGTECVDPINGMFVKAKDGSGDCVIQLYRD